MFVLLLPSRAFGAATLLRIGEPNGVKHCSKSVAMDCGLLVTDAGVNAWRSYLGRSKTISVDETPQSASVTFRLLII